MIQVIIFIIKLIFSVAYMLSSLYWFGLYSRGDQIFRALNAYLAAIFIYCFLWKFWLLRSVDAVHSVHCSFHCCVLSECVMKTFCLFSLRNGLNGILKQIPDPVEWRHPEQ